MDGSTVFGRCRQCAPPVCNTSFPGPIRVRSPNGILIGSAIFAELTALSSGMPMHVLSSKNCRFAWGELDPPSNTRFLGTTRAHNPTGISIGSAVFAGLTTLTDHATRSVTVGRMYTYVVLRCSLILVSLYITRGQVSVRASVTVGVASSVANDVMMRMTSQ